MIYHIELTDTAKRKLKKLDKSTASMIINWLRKNLEGCSNPRQHGKGLTGNRSGSWRYRVGDYRIIAKIEDNRVVILVVDIDHRSSVYKH